MLKKNILVLGGVKFTSGYRGAKIMEICQGLQQLLPKVYCDVFMDHNVIQSVGAEFNFSVLCSPVYTKV